MSPKSYSEELHNLGERIIELRQLYRLSQTKLAKLAGVSRSVIADIEQQKHFPNTLTLLRLCSVFKITTAELCSTVFHHNNLLIPGTERALTHKALSNNMEKVVTDTAISKLRRK